MFKYFAFHNSEYEQPFYFIDEFLFESRLTGFVLRLRAKISVAVIRCYFAVSALWTTK